MELKFVELVFGDFPIGILRCLNRLAPEISKNFDGSFSRTCIFRFR